MTEQGTIRRSSSGADWWRGAVIYQIYPRSFQDSNGDGIGDLPGITSRLPYVASLGVDAVWISPFFASPMKDFGYDVANYREVDPIFGHISDFDHLLERAHDLGLKVMIDLVLSHTSDQHEWFQESRFSRSNAKANWYVWSDPKPDGTPPNNWLSIFGGSAWQWDGRREQYYLHNFLPSQPDLNLHEPEVQNALLDMTRFWLERGVDGFRLDTINFYFADKKLRDNPPLPKEERNASIAPSVNPYNHQRHIYSKNQPENLEFLARFRGLLEEFGERTTVGEVGDAQRGLEILGEYTAGDRGVHMCYAFEFLAEDPLTATRVKDVMDHISEAAKDGWACWAFSNHDVVRHGTRWGASSEALRLLATLLMCLRGSVCIYQGEELGFGEADLAYEDLQDPYGIEFWPEFKGRDGCRTPMVWEASNTHGGFSEARPWLPVCPAHLYLSASEQETRKNSLLSHYKSVIALRRNSEALRSGDLRNISVDGNCLTFERCSAEHVVLCIFNMSDAAIEATVPKGPWRQIGGTIGTWSEGDALAKLDAWQVLILSKTA